MREVREPFANHRATGRPSLLLLRELRNPRSVIRTFQVRTAQVVVNGRNSGTRGNTVDLIVEHN
jgi:hypothetical protein